MRALDDMAYLYVYCGDDKRRHVKYLACGTKEGGNRDDNAGGECRNN
jgi:hypothetical protein